MSDAEIAAAAVVRQNLGGAIGDVHSAGIVARILTATASKRAAERARAATRVEAFVRGRRYPPCRQPRAGQAQRHPNAPRCALMSNALA